MWPDAPALRGIMMQVLQRELDGAGIAWRYGPVRLDDVGTFDGAFVTNAHGWPRSRGIDDVTPDRCPAAADRCGPRGGSLRPDLTAGGRPASVR